MKAATGSVTNNAKNVTKDPIKYMDLVINQ